MTTNVDLDLAARFIWLTGRVLEQRRLETYLGAERDGVLAALAAYRTGDGGYGFGLEPDRRGPVSQPIHALAAARVLEEVDGDAALARGLCDHLMSQTAPDGGLPIVTRSIRPYPRAPWWPIPDEAQGSLLPTAELVGLLYKSGIHHPWLDRAAEFCWQRIDSSRATHPCEAEGVVVFLDNVPDRSRAESQAKRWGEMVRAAGLAPVRPDASDGVLASGYAEGEFHRPYDYAPRPGSLARYWFTDDEFGDCLDRLADLQDADGGWPIRWASWSPATPVEWRPIQTLKAMRILTDHGRLTVSG